MNQENGSVMYLKEWKENNLEVLECSIVNSKQTSKEEGQKNLNRNKFQNEETFGFYKNKLSRD